MKVAVIQDKLSDNKLTDEKLAKQIISPVEEDYHISSLDALAMAELVRQRKIDALRITELTLRITKAMAK